MAPRILLYTGKGGVGKTTSAASTAVLAAAEGLRTLVMSTDAAHSLGDAFGETVGSEPTQVTDGLWVQHIDTQARFETSWVEIQGYLHTVLAALGVDPITADELTIIPGFDEVLALLELRKHVLDGSWDLIVIDCAPSAETLRLLALPEALGWYMNKLFGHQRRLVRAFGPMLSKATGMPMPREDVFEALERLHGELAEVHEFLTSASATVRMVLTPEQVVVAEARRLLTTLSLYGFRVDGIIANRIFPASEDPWMQRWGKAQAEVLAEVRESFGEVALWTSSYRDEEPVGLAALRDFGAALYGEDVPWAPAKDEGPMTVERTDSGAVLTVQLPFATKADVDLARHGEELVVTVGSYRRLLALPAALARQNVVAARVEGGRLQVRFEAEDLDPSQSPGEGGAADG
ncbi:MAG: ArsA family ATPase [Marmoricola sp.]